MSPAPDQALRDVAAACRVISRYVDEDLPEDVLMDAVRMRLTEIGAAVSDLPVSITDAEPDIPWARVALLGEQLVRCPFDGLRPLVLDTARTDVPRLLNAAERLLGSH